MMVKELIDLLRRQHLTDEVVISEAGKTCQPILGALVNGPMKNVVVLVGVAMKLKTETETSI